MRHRNLQGKDTYREVTIPCYDPNSRISAPGYNVPEFFLKEAGNMESKCKEFLKHARPDENNGSYMDESIQTLVNEAIADVRHQRQCHKRLIRLPLTDMHKGDYIHCKQEIKVRKRLIDEYRTKLEMYNKILYQNTAYENYE